MRRIKTRSHIPVWSIGLMTVPERIDFLLPSTLAALKRAGFPDPHLLVDGCSNAKACWYDKFNLPRTIRSEPRLKTFGSWVIAAWTVYCQDPWADRFAIFQDDFKMSLGVFEYLQRCKFPEKGYWNLYTFPSNETVAPDGHVGWYKSDQLGKGAVGLVFNREGIQIALSGQPLLAHPQDRAKGHRVVDGAILHSMKNAGFTEYVHTPSLLQHTGAKGETSGKEQPLAVSFRGEEFDARDLL